jgi:hypothetical protein
LIVNHLPLYLNKVFVLDKCVYASFVHIPIQVIRVLSAEDSKKRLSELCRKLRGATPVRQFVIPVGVSQATWSAWENQTGNLGSDTEAKLVAFIGSSLDEFRKYLAGKVTLEQYLRSPKSEPLPQQSQEMSLSKLQAWIRTLPLNEVVSIANTCIETIKESINQLPKDDESKFELFYNLVSASKRPSNAQIVKMASKLGIETEDLMKLCDRLFPN